MLLSTSELFWVGLVQGAISAPTLELPNDPDHYTEYEPPTTLYHILAEYGELCGLGKAAANCGVLDEECHVDVADIHWGRKGEIREPTDILVGREALIGLASGYRDVLRDGDPRDECAKRFDELLEEHSPVAFGYSPLTPEVLYGLKKSGRITVTARVTPVPRGIVAVLLKMLAPHIDMPAAAFMALTAAGEAIPDWYKGWIPSLWSIERPLQEANRQAAVDVIAREVVGGAREEPAYLLGQHLGRAEQLLRESLDWLDYELATLHRKGIYTQSLEFIPAEASDEEQPAEASSEETADEDLHSDEEAAGEPEDGESSDESPIDEWQEEIGIAAKAAITQVGLGGVDLPPADAGLLRHAAEAVRSLEVGKSLAMKLGIDTLIPTLNNGIASASALINETARPAEISSGTWHTQQERNRASLAKYPDLLRAIIPLAFGELRLKELVLDGDSQGLEPSSLEGWSKLVGNARAAVRDGLALLKNGFPPYVVINAVQPTLEAVVRSLAAKHLHTFRGGDLGGMLFAVLQHAKEQRDGELEAVAAIGLALRTPRNNAVHDSDRVFDKHDAAFFLNGLAIMLRAL